jgi:hypothetical protein
MPQNGVLLLKKYRIFSGWLADKLTIFVKKSKSREIIQNENFKDAPHSTIICDCRSVIDGRKIGRTIPFKPSGHQR